MKLLVRRIDLSNRPSTPSFTNSRSRHAERPLTCPSARLAQPSMATGYGTGTPAPAASSSPCRSCAWLVLSGVVAGAPPPSEQALISVVGTATCSGCRHGGWRSWSPSSALRSCRRVRSARWIFPDRVAVVRLVGAVLARSSARDDRQRPLRAAVRSSCDGDADASRSGQTLADSGCVLRYATGPR